MGRLPYWKKYTNGLDQTASVIQKFTDLVWGSPSSRFVNIPGRKSKLYLAPIHG
jgi:hypothetical protein